MTHSQQVAQQIVQGLERQIESAIRRAADFDVAQIEAALAAERDAARAEGERLRAALLAVARPVTRMDGPPNLCWCLHGPTAPHEQVCDLARAALASENGRGET